jgi:hypothetical protein
VLPAKAHRELGIESLHVKIADDFDAPLPVALLAAFQGLEKNSKRRER